MGTAVCTPITLPGARTREFYEPGDAKVAFWKRLAGGPTQSPDIEHAREGKSGRLAHWAD
jgi:hypothetical protein